MVQMQLKIIQTFFNQTVEKPNNTKTSASNKNSV